MANIYFNNASKLLWFFYENILIEDIFFKSIMRDNAVTWSLQGVVGYMWMLCIADE